ncbi:MAG TPA: GNAT family protein [Kofleriaceae bacterium]|nr:GNAT family protein [Kofleriaceae bacterium]
MPPRGPAYRIETPRLVLRCWALEDAVPLQAVLEEHIAELTPWLSWATREVGTLEQRVADLRRMRRRFDGDEDYGYGVFDRDSGEVVGGCGLHLRAGPGAREIGYWVRPDRWGQGLATELSAALTRVAFEVDGVDRVDVRCDPANRASARVAEKLGYRHEATLRVRLHAGDGSLRDAMIWSMLAAELPGSPAARLAAGIAARDALGARLL